MGQAIDVCVRCGEYAPTSDEDVCQDCYEKEKPMHPLTLAKLYDDAHDAVSAAQAKGCAPRDIVAVWPNVLGMLRRVPGQRYHRSPPNGREDPPTETELEALAYALKVHRKRCEDAVARLEAKP